MTNRDDLCAETIYRIAEAADAFLRSLGPDQRRKAVFRLDDAERFNWDYRPRQRAGISLREMDSSQQRRALALLANTLSARANATVLQIMGLERILGQLEGPAGRHRRDPDLYFVTFFGEPFRNAPWGWRFEGHHLSLNFLIADNRLLAATPNFFGANPARVPQGPLQGFRTLPQEEDAARALLAGLSDRQKKKTLIAAEAPADIVTAWTPRLKLDDPVGVALSDLNLAKQQLLLKLVQVYVRRLPPELADRYLNTIEKEGTGYIHFAWAGSSEPGRPHYYRLHGPSFLAEYDNTQNDANHIHSVWRDLKRDWGEDLLKRHYRQSHP